MKSSNKGRHTVRNGLRVQQRTSAQKPRTEMLSELPLVAILLVAAVLVAALAAGGPVLDVLGDLTQG